MPSIYYSSKHRLPIAVAGAIAGTDTLGSQQQFDITTPGSRNTASQPVIRHGAIPPSVIAAQGETPTGPQPSGVRYFHPDGQSLFAQIDQYGAHVYDENGTYTNEWVRQLLAGTGISLHDDGGIVTVSADTGNGVQGGTAFYTNDTAYVLGPADTWTPDISTNFVASGVDDHDIGCTPQSASGGLTSYLEIPYGWMWWATIAYSFWTAEPPPTGEFMVGKAFNMGYVINDLDQGTQQAINAPLYDTSGPDALPQTITASLHGSAGVPESDGWPYPIGFGPGGDGIFPGVLSTVFGTEFIPAGLSISLQAISTFDQSTTSFEVE